jgi:hypothetical protein
MNSRLLEKFIKKSSNFLTQLTGEIFYPFSSWKEKKKKIGKNWETPRKQVNDEEFNWNNVKRGNLKYW